MGCGSSAAKVSQEFSVAAVEIGPDRIVRRIGQGSMGVVYHACDVAHDRDVALKVMLPEVMADDGARLRFSREARAAASLRHRNIVSVFDFEEHGEAPYIAMELPEARQTRKSTVSAQVVSSSSGRMDQFSNGAPSSPGASLRSRAQR